MPRSSVVMACCCRIQVWTERWGWWRKRSSSWSAVWCLWSQILHVDDLSG